MRDNWANRLIYQYRTPTPRTQGESSGTPKLVAAVVYQTDFCLPSILGFDLSVVNGLPDFGRVE